MNKLIFGVYTMADPTLISMNNLLYSCSARKEYVSQQFIGENILCYIIAGELRVQTQKGLQTLQAGNLCLFRRHQLIKSIQVPPTGGDFQSISIILDQAFLSQYAEKAQIAHQQRYLGDSLRIMPSDELLTGYFESILSYFKLNKPLIPAIANLKTQEAVALLLNLEPEFEKVLFDFSEPGKIDLEEFMKQNFIYNVRSADFAKLTGRSLATFKRDFEKIFKATPSQWLLDKRLREAHYLIKQKGKKPLDVYLNVGFENLSHFSFAFKKAFGNAPSRI